MQKILNYINGEWLEPNVSDYVDVINPATGFVIARAPLSRASDVEAAAQAAAGAFPAWRRVPANERVQYLFKLRDLLKAHQDEIARAITNECGKTFDESKAEMVRAIENVEVACGIPMMSKGEMAEDIAPGIDELMIRQPVGVCATIAPFNFPGMIPFWYLPYALATGNTYIIKPSEKVPMTMQLIFKLIEQVGFPKASSTWSTAPKKQWTRFSTTRSSARLRLLAPRRWRNTSIAAPPPMASVCRRRAEQKTRWWCCPMPIWRWPSKSSPIRPLAALVSAAWRFRGR